MKIIVTGGYGFIGSHLVKKLLKNKSNIVLNLDAIKYSAMPEALNLVKHSKNYLFKKDNLQNIKNLNNIIKKFKPNIIFNLAAESHVDNSINNPDDFVNSNIIGTYNLLQAIKKNLKSLNNFKFIHISTDEVFGSLDNKRIKPFSENSKFYPNSPYSSTKACSDILVRAWNKTYKVPTIITNCVNNFGPWQFPEKLIPVVIYSCINKFSIPVYGSGKNIREWIYVEDHVDYLIKISKKGKIGNSYNIGSGIELENISIIKKICKYFDKKFPQNKSHYSLVKHIKDRPAHDFRYALNTTKINEILNIKTYNNFDNYLKKTIDWYLENKKWIKKKHNYINK